MLSGAIAIGSCERAHRLQSIGRTLAVAALLLSLVGLLVEPRHALGPEVFALARQGGEGVNLIDLDGQGFGRAYLGRIGLGVLGHGVTDVPTRTAPGSQNARDDDES